MYLLKCSVCRGEFQRKDDWTKHLFSNTHQSKARAKCNSWNNEMKDCAIVVYCQFPVPSPSGHKLLRYLSKELSTFVTDFVWRDSNPRVAIVQFESRTKAEAWTLQCDGAKPEIIIDDQLVQIRKATDLLDVEWETLLPDVPQIFPQDPSPEMLRQRRESNQVGESFQNRISRMLEAVIIPESEYSKALTVMESIRMMMAGLTGRGRALQVDMFRNWYLQFRSTFRSNFLLIHVHYLEDSTSKGLSFITASQIQDIITRNKNTFKYSDTRHLIAGAADCEGYGLTHQQSGMGFGLVIAPSAVAEVQRSRLLQFYCKFDPRIKPLLGIVHLWARINNIRFGETNIQFSHTHCHVPDPGALEWFVVFFLCDKWLIPTPREVQEQPHRSITYRNNLVDMGFTEDEQFASNWSTNSSLVDNDVDNAMLDLLTLAGEFFAFVYNISVNCQVHPCILNTRDAEVLRKDFLQGTKKAELTTKLRPEEVSDLQEELSKQLYNFRNIIMMHPFNLRWRFSISNGYFIKIVTPRVKVVGEKLQSFVELRKKELDQRGQFSNKIKSINLDHLLLCRIVK